MSKQSCKSRIMEQDALDIHDGTAFGFIVPHSSIKLAGDNEGRLCTRVPEAPGVLKDRLRRIVTTIRDARMKGSLLAPASWDKESQVNANGSGTLPSGKDCLVSSRRRRRPSFANGSTWAVLAGLGTNFETVVNLRPVVVLVGWRATGNIGQVHCRRARARSGG